MWVRTAPVTFLHDSTGPSAASGWHKLSYAVRGYLEVVTDDLRRIIPGDRAVWVPAGTEHSEVMRAPLSLRSLYIAPGAASDWPATCRTIAVSPLLRELILHISRIGALDRRVAAQARLVGVLFDLLAAAAEVPLNLPLPRDPRARAFADLVTAEPGADKSLATLARKAGASVRTLERCFSLETGLAVGAWRRRVRLFHALRLLEAGGNVTEVGFDAGYATTSAFSAAFSRQFGRPPSGRRRS